MNRQVSSDRRRALCRSVGPTAWVVLEELVEEAVRERNELVARTNVRRLAADLALSKDTIARALRRLVDAGIAERVMDRRDPTGRFGGSAYVVDARALGLVEDRPRPDARKRTLGAAQPRLFEAGTETAP